MKIAICAPSPIPFVFGGAENLYAALHNFINEETHHACELIKVPGREHSYEQLLEGYRRYSRVNLDHFDLVVSTKYPSWMVSHPNHACFMQHTLRGFYDTYHFTGLPEAFDWEGEGLGDVRRAMDELLKAPKPGNAELEPMFDLLATVPQRVRSPDLLKFPGPLVRQMVRFLDSYALAPSRIRSYFAQSHTVKNREDYFPPGVPVKVLYPAPRLSRFHCRRDDFFFTASRLDHPKRIDVIIEAMRHVKADIPLLIGGVGHEMERLQALAKDDPRVKLLGHLTDEQLLDYYANALAIVFVPYDEDYGYITIEAMKSGKPVLTFTDSGGPNEFVFNGETGFSVPPSREALAERMDWMASHRAETREMGRNARRKVEGIGWRPFVEKLTGEPLAAPRVHTVPSLPARRRKLAVTMTYPIYPPRGGGQSRIFHLFRKLARHVDVEVVTLCGPGGTAFSREVAPGLVEMRVPQSDEHARAEYEYSTAAGGVPVTDVVMSELFPLTPAYAEALRRACTGADAIVTCTYLYKAVRSVAPDIRMWLDAQNMEYELKRDILPKNGAGRALLERVREDEEASWKGCELVFACAARDLDSLARFYGGSDAVQLEVPNGVSVEDVKFVAGPDRRELKERLGLADVPVALFMGSWHGPNIEAAQRVFDYARMFPDARFLVMGSVCNALQDRPLPENVRMLGVLDDEEKNVALAAADVALNPMTSGSGSNLKMLDYFAAGVPVISTAFGVRGIDAVPGTHFMLAEPDDFPMELSMLFLGLRDGAAMARASRSLVEQHYAWDVLAERFLQALNERQLLPQGETAA